MTVVGAINPIAFHVWKTRALTWEEAVAFVQAIRVEDELRPITFEADPWPIDAPQPRLLCVAAVAKTSACPRLGREKGGRAWWSDMVEAPWTRQQLFAACVAIGRKLVANEVANHAVVDLPPEVMRRTEARDGN